jgi:hypothetical protein
VEGGCATGNRILEVARISRMYEYGSGCRRHVVLVLLPEPALGLVQLSPTVRHAPVSVQIRARKAVGWLPPVGPRGCVCLLTRLFALSSRPSGRQGRRVLKYRDMTMRKAADAEGLMI